MVNGWERVDYIKPGADFHPTLSFDFDEAFDLVKREVENVRDAMSACARSTVSTGSKSRVPTGTRFSTDLHAGLSPNATGGSGSDTCSIIMAG